MHFFFRNYPLFVPALAWGIAQTMKIVIRLRNPRFDKKHVAASGGMPSCHAAAVSSVCTTVAVIEGISSVLFAVSLIFSIIVLYDATHVRYEAEKHAKILNRLLRDSSEKEKSTLLEYLGHTPKQVFVGVVLGITFSLIFLYG